jgi:RNA polymerase sigma-70 factor, ECF subfamily
VPTREDYDRLIRPFEEQMLLTIGRLVRDADRAADVLQDSLTKLWSGLDRLRSHPNPRAYVLSVCISVAHDALRRLKRVEAAQLVMAAEAYARAGVQEPVSVIAGQEVEQAVLKAISQLPAQQATAVVLRLLHEQSYAEIAQALECQETTARTHVARAREALARDLARFADPVEDRKLS